MEGEILSNTKVSEKLDRFTNVGDKMADKDSNLKKLDLTVIVDRATYVEKDGYGSYTFPVMQHREENIRNVLLSPNGNEGYDAFLIEYSYNLDALADGLSPEQMAESVEVVPLAPGTDPLAGKIHSTWICAYEYIKSYGYINGSGGNLTGDTGYRWVLHATTCYVAHTYTEDRSTYSADGSTRTINIDLPGSGGGGGLSTSPVPTIYDEEELLRINVLKKELNTNLPERKYIDGHPSNAFRLHGFLADNGFSAASKGFAKAALHALMDGGEVDFEDRIINEFTGKVDCIYKKLLQKTLTEPGIVQNTYIAFNPDLNFTEYFLTYRLGKLSTGIAGQTKRLSSLSFEITLNSDLIDNRSPIEIARTILHENIHALLYKHYYNGKDSFIDIFKDYIKKTTGNNLHHSIIAAKYIVPIANALKRYDENRESDIYYTYLAWEGIPDEYRDPNVTDDMIFAARNKFRAKGLKCN